MEVVVDVVVVVDDAMWKGENISEMACDRHRGTELFTVTKNIRKIPFQSRLHF